VLHLLGPLPNLLLRPLLALLALLTLHQPCFVADNDKNRLGKEKYEAMGLFFGTVFFPRSKPNPTP
jgi:hypothetical protein